MKPQHILFVVTSASRMTNGKATGLWAEEFTVPYLLCRSAGLRITVASAAGGSAPLDPRSAAELDQHPDWQPALAALGHTEPLNKTHADPFDALFIPGGHGCMFDLAHSAAMARLLREFRQQQKFIAAVCHGPAAFIEARDEHGIPLVHNRKLTAFSNAEEDAVGLTSAMPFLLETELRQHGAHFVAADNFTEHAIRDEWLITGQNPASSAAAAKLLLQALGRKEMA
ncbi:MAG: type 1 glutamine amidotransferase domain-containing protein [Permianibacter sp.]